MPPPAPEPSPPAGGPELSRAGRIGRHTRDDLAAFQNGETRLVYARHRDRPDDPLFHLADGTAAQLRDFTRDHLECFLPTCTDRRLKAVSRAHARDGFSHLPGAGQHSPESLFHHQGKAAIARWARAHLPDVTVTVEHATADRARRADVMLTWPNGAQLAVEVQYSPLTVAEWRRRHESYLAAGITPLWLFGHTRHQLHIASARRGDIGPQVRLNAVQKALLAAGTAPLWLNPITGQIATVWTTSTPATTTWPTTLPPVPPSWSPQAPPAHRAPNPTLLWQWVSAAATNVAHDPDDPPTRPIPAHPDAAQLGIAVADLARCRATPTGLVTPVGQLLDHNAEDLTLARAATAARRGAAARTWAESDLRGKVLARYGQIPPVFAYTSPVDLGIHAAPEHWRALLYGDLVLTGPPGTTRTVADCIDLLERRGVVIAHRRLTEAAVTGYLGLLADAGCLTLTAAAATVVADLATVAARRQDAARAAAAHTASLTRMNHYRARRLQLQADRTPEPATPADPTAPTRPDDGRILRCSGCGNRIAIELRHVGRHPFC